jgi:hypothetical protein
MGRDAMRPAAEIEAGPSPAGGRAAATRPGPRGTSGRSIPEAADDGAVRAIGG